MMEFISLKVVWILLLLPISLFASGLNKEQTLKLINTFEKHNSPRLEQKHGVPLRYILFWDQQELTYGMFQYLNKQAGGARIEGSAIRDSRLTSDGVLLGPCHELGHLIRDRQIVIKYMAQPELLADFFANSECFMDFLRIYPNLTSAKEQLPVVLPTNLIFRCGQQFGAEANLCLRALQASFSASTFIGFAHPQCPSASWSRKAKNLNDLLQCSLESYVAGIFHDPMPDCYNLEK